LYGIGAEAKQTNTSCFFERARGTGHGDKVRYGDKGKGDRVKFNLTAEGTGRKALGFIIPVTD